MKQQLFNVFRVNDDKGISPSRVANLRNTNPLQTVTLTHVAKDRWVRNGIEYTLKPCNSKQTYITFIKGIRYLLIATVLNGQISIFDQLNKGVKTMLHQLKRDAQSKYCAENQAPNFAGDGECYGCRKNVFDRYTLEQASNELITGCPFCLRTFCD